MFLWQDRKYRDTKFPCALVGGLKTRSGSHPPSSLGCARNEEAEEEPLVSKARIKDQVLHTRLSRDERAAFRAFRDENGLTSSEVLRRLARQAAGFRPTYDGETREAILEYARQLKAIGTNINQIARILNSGRTPDYPTLRAGIGRLTRELVAQSEDYVSLCTRTRKWAQKQIAADRSGCRCRI